MPERKNILICPLNWGLGHASRCIPIIRILNHAGHNVIIAAGGPALLLLQNVFRENKCIRFDDYHVRYSKGNHLVIKVVLQTPKIFFRILLEHCRLKRIIKEYRIDAVISDNRFGLWNRNVRSVYMTHQLFIKGPRKSIYLENLLKKIHSYFIEKYDVCWIPDLPGSLLSGELSGKFSAPSNARFIGLLTDFLQGNPVPEVEFEICAVISGPEPQRTIFYEMVRQQLIKSGKKSVLICGIPSESIVRTTDQNVTIFNYLPPSEVQKYLLSSEIIIARPGYSTIMDMAASGKRAILIPTPGQTEQEYLAQYFWGKKIFYTCSQHNFNLSLALEKAIEYSGIYIHQDTEELKKAIFDSIDLL